MTEISIKHLEGSWKCCYFDADNCDKYLAQLGVAWAIRKVGKNCKQTIELKQEDAGLHIITSTRVTSTDDHFKFTVPRLVTTKDGRKSTVIFTVKDMKDLRNKDKANLTEEDLIDIQEDDEDLSYEGGKFAINGENTVYLHKQESWTDSKGRQQKAKITMKITRSGQMYCRMSCNGIVVRRLHDL